MKNFLLLCFAFVITTTVMGQELNQHAKFIKENYSTDYTNTIRKFAVDEWKDDYQMIVYTINKQADALYELVSAFKSDNTSIAYKAIIEWSHDGYEAHNEKEFKNLKVFGVEQLMKLHCDWSMVKYTYDKQAKAKTAF